MKQKIEVVVEKIRERLAGKKTYLLSGLLVVTVLVLVFLGRLTPETALTVALVFAGLLSASYRSAIEQHHQEVLSLLYLISETGQDVLTHQVGKALPLLKTAAPIAEQLASELKAEHPGAKS